MLTLEKRQGGGKQIFDLSGTIDDADNLEALFGPITAHIVVSCGAVKRINSIGVKTWMKFFGALEKRKIEMVFEKVSPALVEQLNMVQNFTCSGKVTSVFAPYNCSPCKTTFDVLLDIETIKKCAYQVGPVKCPKCGAEAEFDDIPEEFFSFLAR